MSTEWAAFGGAIGGAVVGGGLSLLGSIWATRNVVESSSRLATEERRQRSHNEERVGASSLLAEIRTTLKVLDQPETLTGNTLVPFSMDAWNSNKGLITRLRPEAQDDIQEAYAEMSFANLLAAHNLQLPWGTGRVSKPYRQHVESMIP